MTTTTDCRRTTFGGLTIDHDDSVLEPRDWTLLQSAWAAEMLGRIPAGPVLELCCGAGHIGLEAVRRSDVALVQVDVSESACDFARRNGLSAGLAERVEVRCVDLATLRTSAERFAMVLADPPYVPSEQVHGYPADPLLAIDGGSDGLSLLRECVAVIDAVLLDGGVALVQVAGATQAMDLAPLLPDTLGITEIREHDTERAVLALEHRTSASGPRRTTGDR